MNSNGKFFFRPARGEQIEAKLHIDTESRSGIHGVVLNRSGAPVPDALVLLFRAENGTGGATSISQAYTDPEGHFVFGALEGDVLYLIRIFKNDIKIRELEIITE